MALENAKEFLKRVMSDKALCARVGEKEPTEVVEIAKELGFDVTVEELEGAVKALRQAAMQELKELNFDEMDKAVGGTFWGGEDAPDGHEMGCAITWHHYNWQKEHNIWCNQSFYCKGNHLNENGVYHSENCRGYYNNWLFEQE